MNDLPGETIPFHALYAADGKTLNSEAFDARKVITNADIIFAVDVMTDHMLLVYGREALQRIATGSESEVLSILKIAIDEETEELHTLLKLLEDLKGRHDFESQAAGKAPRKRSPKAGKKGKRPKRKSRDE